MRRRETRSRGELSREVDEGKEQLDAQIDEVGKGVNDTEVVEGTRRAVREGLTEEGKDAADTPLEAAEGIARDHAEKHDAAAAELEREGEERGLRLGERIDLARETRDTATRDVEKLHVQESMDRVELAVKEIHQEIEIISEIQRRDDESRLECQRLLEELRARITGRSRT